MRHPKVRTRHRPLAKWHGVGLLKGLWPRLNTLDPSPPATERQTQAYNRAGQLVASVRSAGTAERETHLWRYAWQARTQQRVLAQELQGPGQAPSQGPAPSALQSELRQGSTASRFDAQGRLLAVQGGDQNSSNATYNPNGQPERMGHRTYTWDALGRLTQVSEGDKPVAAYTYDHRGLRTTKTMGGQGSGASSNTSATTHTVYNDSRQPLAELDAQGRITRQYLWLADMLLAVMDSAQGAAPARSADTADGQALSQDIPLWQDLWALLQSWGQAATASVTGLPWQITFIHSNHLGAPELATNAQGLPVWAADYAPFGAATVRAFAGNTDRAQASAFVLNLRLPGQMFDPETGLHYNRQRYYDPQLGQYLSPDPLGQPDGPNAYLYVAGNPLAFVDPDGLVLFAFDGTGNDESNANELSNVVRFRDLYASDKEANYYITGPGTLDPRSGIENPWYKGGNPLDGASSLTGKERIAFLVNDLQTYSNEKPDDEVVDIDIVGFSRGAAEARDFANQIVAKTRNGWFSYRDDSGQHCQKVNFRFMGLFDTVLSVHSGSYSLSIPKEFAYVAQAVAMNEYRNLFPLESIAQGQFSAAPTPGQTRIERGFVGSHSDIGGSFADGDLAKVALVWMVNQATEAGITMKPLTSEQTQIIASPVIHDKSSNLYASTGPAPTTSSEDRVIRFGDGSSPRQRTALVGNGTGYEDTTSFITYSSSPTGNAAGTVDMNKYLEWLNKNDYGISMTVK